MPLDPVSLGISAAMQVPKLVVGLSQLSQSNKALKALGKEQYPGYSSSPEMQGAYARAQAMSQYGYSPEERAANQQQQARNNTEAFQQARDNGGAYVNNNAEQVNQFAAGDASLKRQNIQYADSLAQQLQQQKNMQTQNLIARRQMLEQSYGQAKSSALANITGAAAGAGAIFGQAGLGTNNGLGNQTDTLT